MRLFKVRCVDSDFIAFTPKEIDVYVVAEDEKEASEIAIGKLMYIGYPSVNYASKIELIAAEGSNGGPHLLALGGD